jgi:hypothetical protein
MNENDKTKLTKYIQQWDIVEEEIKSINHKLNTLYKQRQEIETKIDRYKDLFNNDKKIRIINHTIYTTKKTKPLSLKLLKNIIDSYFNKSDFNKDAFYKYILKNRDFFNKTIIKKSSLEKPPTK